MGRLVFLWGLGGLTALVGALVLGMWLARRGAVRPRRAPELCDDGASEATMASLRAVGTAAAAAPPEAIATEPGTAAAICPTCGVRYPAGRMTCVRDESPLARLH